MTITKIGHCCLLIEAGGKRIMTDPGAFTAEDNAQEHIDLVVITHEHGDHLHIESLKEIVALNPDVTVVSNGAVGKLLAEAGIAHKILEGTAAAEFVGVALEAFDARHAEIFEEVGQVQNTGYFIAERLFYPGDAYAEPGKSVEILAAPAGGPWCRTTDALHYAIKINPKHAFPVHDAIERPDLIHIIHGHFERILGEAGITFRSLKAGETVDFN